MTVDFQEIQQMVKANSDMLINISANISKLDGQNTVYMTVSEAAKYIRVSPSTIRRYLNEIKHFRRDRIILFEKSELDIWVNKFKS